MPLTMLTSADTIRADAVEITMAVVMAT